MMKYLPAVCLATAVVSGLASSADAAPMSPFANGDFETGSLSPWVVNPGSNGDQIQVASSAILTLYGAGSVAADGLYVVDFNGGNSPVGGTLSQTFATVTGSTYSVTFQYGSTTGGPEKVDASVLGVNGQTDVLSSLAVTASSPPVALTSHTFLFKADGTSATVSFLDDLSNPTNAVDGVLDNVSVAATTPVPEPATAGLLAVAGSGLLARRRRRSL